jgi:hypothetical protein
MEAAKVVDLPVVGDGQALDDWLWSTEELEAELTDALTGEALEPRPPDRATDRRDAQADRRSGAGGGR